MSENEKTPAELEADAAEKALMDVGSPKDLAPAESAPVEEPAAEPTPVEGEPVATPAPAAVPAASPEPAKPEGEGDDEDGVPKLKDGKPTPQDWENVRNIVRTLKGENKELKSKVSSAPAPVAPAPAAAAAPAAPSIKDEDVFKIAVDAQVDKFKDPAKSKALLRQAQDLIDEMTPDRVLKVIKQAKNGEFGDESADVLIMARDALVESNARETVNSKASAAEAQKVDETTRKVGESFARVTAKYPELSSKDNPALATFAQKWREQYIGKVDKNGQMVEAGPMASVLASTTNWPEVIADMIINAYKASGGKIVATEGKPKPTYVPDAGGEKSASGTAPSGAAADVERQLAKMGTIRKG